MSAEEMQYPHGEVISMNKSKKGNFWGDFSFPFDPEGQERFTSMTRLYYREASACIIMFDVTNVSTFSNSQKWKQDLDSKLTLPDGSPVPCLLLANKVSSSRHALCVYTWTWAFPAVGDVSTAKPCPVLYHSLWAF